MSLTVYRISGSHCINLAQVKHFRVGRGFATGWAVKGDDTVLMEGFESQKQAEFALSSFLHDLGTTVILPDG